MNLNKDLSLIHGLIGNIFPDISAEEAWEKYKLNDDQVNFFNEYGYLHNIKILEEVEIEILRNDLKELMGAKHANNDLFYEYHSNESVGKHAVLFHSLGHWRITKGFHDAIWNPRFLIAAYQLLGNKAVRFWHDQLFCKPAHHGGVVAWHQDYSYWTRTFPQQHLTCWIGLDDVDKENGCVYYIPKSHQWKLLEMPNLTGDMDGLNKYLTKEQQIEFSNKVAIEMTKGYATFHHPLMVHGSYENKSPKARRAMVLNVFADGTLSNSNQELLPGVPTIKKGSKIDGQFFPLLFDPGKMG